MRRHRLVQPVLVPLVLVLTASSSSPLAEVVVRVDQF
jgi:hypothetical protein